MHLQLLSILRGLVLFHTLGMLVLSRHADREEKVPGCAGHKLQGRSQGVGHRETYCKLIPQRCAASTANCEAVTVVYARAFVDAMNRCLWLSKAVCGHFDVTWVFVLKLRGFGFYRLSRVSPCLLRIPP